MSYFAEIVSVTTLGPIWGTTNSTKVKYYKFFPVLLRKYFVLYLNMFFI